MKITRIGGYASGGECSVEDAVRSSLEAGPYDYSGQIETALGEVRMLQEAVASLVAILHENGLLADEYIKGLPSYSFKVES